MRSGDRYYQALAQPTSRKLALLVGINQYPEASLAGCVTDVQLQQELLIHRFGFVPSDIVVLTDLEATRQNIETAFFEHLSKQAQPGDVVVFHFSGYGSQIEGKQIDPIPNTEFPNQNLLLPIDGILSGNNQQIVNGLSAETLWMLLRSLDTEKVTMVLDTSYINSGIELRGNLRVRSRSVLPGQLSAEELAFQEQLRQIQLKTQIPGVLLAAAGPTQLATEGQIDGFSAGLFTYALTQYLWQATPATSVQVSLDRVRESVVQVVGNAQQPKLTCQINPDRTLLAYQLLPDSKTGADGVVTAVESDGKTARIWLGGIPIDVLGLYGINSLFTLLPLPGSQTPAPQQLAIRERSGLDAKAEISPSPTSATYQLQVGQLVQEAVRVLPRTVKLVVALDASLERIEIVDATSAFARIANVSLVNAGEKPADYVFGRVQISESSHLSPQYALFSPGLDVLPSTVGEAGEAVKTAVQRLVPELETLLAAKKLRLSANEGSSRLGVRASLEIVPPDEQVLMQRTTDRAPQPAPAVASLPVATNKSSILSLPVGTRIQYRLHNFSDAPVYFMLLGRESNGDAIAILPGISSPDPDRVQSTAETQAIGIGQSIIVPDVSSPFKWLVQGPAGLTEIQIIFSRKPFARTFAILESTQYLVSNYQRVSPLLNPLSIAQAVLEDLHQAGVSEQAIATSSDFNLDVNTWATLSFIYEVV